MMITLVITTHDQTENSIFCRHEKIAINFSISMMTAITPLFTPMKTLQEPTQDFLSIKEAAEIYQKAEITIRRFVRNVVKEEKGDHRNGIHPLPTEANKLKKSKKPFSYTISKELLQEHFGINEKKTSAKAPASDQYLSLLEKTNSAFENQLQVKDDQIKQLAQAIEELSQRQRETNILMKGMQEQMLLRSGNDAIDSKQSWWKFWAR